MAISYIGSATGATSATLPAHQAGDLIVAFAYRSGNTTAPSLPFLGWTDIASTGANTNSSRLAYKIAASSGTAADTWSNATCVIFAVYRSDSNSTLDVGVNGVGNGSSTTVNYPALTLQVNSGSSWVVGFAGHRSTNTALENPPSGTVNRTSLVNTAEVALHDTNGGVSSWTSKNVSVGGTSSGWQSRVLEIREIPPPPGALYEISNTADDVFWSGTLLADNDVNQGRIGSNLYQMGLRFRGVSVPAGSTINSATILLCGTNGNLIGPYGNLYGIAEDNAVAWGTTASTRPGVGARPFTSASTSITGAGYPVRLNVTSIVSEIIGRPGWALGNAIAFSGDDAAAANNYRVYADFRIGDGNAAKLYIEFTPPGSGSTTYNQSVTVTGIATPAVARRSGKTFSASSTAAVAPRKSVARGFASISAGTVAVTNRAGKVISSSAVANVAVSASRRFLAVLNATATGVVSVARFTAKGIAATSSAATGLARSVGKPFTIATGSVAALGKLARKLLAASSATAVTAAASKAIGVVIAATVAGIASTTRRTSRAVSIAANGSIGFVKATGLRVATAVSGALAIRKAIARSISAQTVGAVAGSRSVRKAIAAAATSSVSVIFGLAYLVGINIAVSAATSIRKATGKTLTASGAAAVQIAKRAGKAIAAASSASVGAAKRIGKTIASVATGTVSMVKGIGATVRVSGSAVVNLTAGLAARTVAVVIEVSALASTSIAKQARKGMTTASTGAAALRNAMAFGLNASVASAAHVAKAVSKTVQTFVCLVVDLLARLVGGSPTDPGRVVTVAAESRFASVFAQLRKVFVPADSRLGTVTAEIRTATVPADDRATALDAQNRTAR